MRFDKELNAWVFNKNILGNAVEIRLTDIDLRPQLTKEKILDDAISYVENHSKEIEKNITNSLWNKYNEGWTDPEEGILKLSRKEFISNFVLNAINYEVEDEFNGVFYLYYLDSGIFDGHSIEVFIENDGEISSELVG